MCIQVYRFDLCVIWLQVDIQALAHAVELTRQGAVDSLRFAKGDLLQAFQVTHEISWSYILYTALMIILKVYYFPG